jgi:hypothetical protein
VTLIADKRWIAHDGVERREAWEELSWWRECKEVCRLQSRIETLLFKHFRSRTESRGVQIDTDNLAIEIFKGRPELL